MDLRSLPPVDRLRLISQLADALADELTDQLKGLASRAGNDAADSKLAVLATAGGSSTDPGTTAAPSGGAGAARQLLRLRRKRDAIFGADLFADPAWDILLDLRVAAAAGTSVSVSSACIAAAVPQTTALRWIGILVERGLITREPSPADRRIIYLRLCSDTTTMLDELLRLS